MGQYNVLIIGYRKSSKRITHESKMAEYRNRTLWQGGTYLMSILVFTSQSMVEALVEVLVE